MTPVTTTPDPVAIPLTPELFLNDAISIAVTLTKLLVALMPVLAVLAPVVLPMIAASFRNKKHGEAFDTVTRMGLLATNTAADKIRDGMEKAMAPDSPGGVVVTQGELLAIYADAMRAAFQWAKENRVLKSTLDVFGGEDEVKKALVAIIRKKLSGSPVGSVSGMTTPAAVPLVSSAMLPTGEDNGKP